MAAFCRSLRTQAGMDSPSKTSSPEHASFVIILLLPSLTHWAGKCLVIVGFGLRTSRPSALDVVVVNLELEVLQSIHIALLGDCWKLNG